MRRSSSLLRLPLFFLFALSLAAPCWAQFGAIPRPNLLGLFPSGGKAGTTVRVKITEQFQLEEALGLWFSHPGLKATPVMREKDAFYPEPRPTTNEFDVVIAPNTPPGAYEVRGLSRYGMTNARRFVVGQLPEEMEAEDNNDFEKANPLQVGVTMNGTFNSDYDHFRFQAKKGQTLVLSCEAWRVDSRGDAVLTVYDLKGRELDRVHDTAGSDPVLDFTPPADGEYIVRVHELTYTASGGRGTAPYRLTIDTKPWVDYIDPPYVSANAPTKVKVYGRNLGAKPSKRTLYGRPLEMLEVTINPNQLTPSSNGNCSPSEGTLPMRDYRVNTPRGPSNAITLPLVSEKSTAETEPNEAIEKAQTLTAPAFISARFDRPGDIDGYRFQAKKGEKYWIEVQSQRLRQPTDPAFVVQQLSEDKEGGWRSRDLKTASDMASPAGNFRLPFASDDAALLFEAPSDGEFRILVRDEYGASDTSQPLHYRLIVRKPEPSFQALSVGGLTLSANRSNNRPLKPMSCIVQPGSAAEVVIVAYRQQGFEGEIKVSLKTLPPGVTCEPLILTANQTMGALLLRAKPGAANWNGPVQIVAESQWQGAKLTQEVKNVELLWDSPRDNRSPTACRLSSPLLVSIDKGHSHVGVLETPSRVFKTARGGKLKIPLKFAKTLEAYKGTLSVNAINAPDRVTAPALTLTAGKQADLQLDLLQDVKPGTYTLFFRGECDLDFERAKAVLDRVTADQKRIAQLSREATQAYQKATQAKRVADQAVNTANSALTSRKSAQQRAVQANTAAQRTLTAAKQRMQKDESDAAKAALASAEKQAQQTAAALKKAEVELTQATSALEAAKDKQAKAIVTEAAAKKHSDKGVALKREIDQKFNSARTMARKTKIKIPVHSDPITLQVAKMPFQYKSPSAALKLKQGDMVPAAFAILRELEFKGDVDVQLDSTSSGRRIRLEKTFKIAGSASNGNINIVADKTLQPGEYQCQWIVRTRFNNRSLEDRLPLTIVVEAAPAVAKK